MRLSPGRRFPCIDPSARCQVRGIKVEMALGAGPSRWAPGAKPPGSAPGVRSPCRLSPRCLWEQPPLPPETQTGPGEKRLTPVPSFQVNTGGASAVVSLASESKHMVLFTEQNKARPRLILTFPAPGRPGGRAGPAGAPGPARSGSCNAALRSEDGRGPRAGCGVRPRGSTLGGTGDWVSGPHLTLLRLSPPQGGGCGAIEERVCRGPSSLREGRSAP